LPSEQAPVDQRSFWFVHSAGRLASIGRRGGTKAAGKWLPSGSVTARRGMPPVATEDRASCKDAGLMVVSDPS
jgi:hypothetical protein